MTTLPSSRARSGLSHRLTATTCDGGDDDDGGALLLLMPPAEDAGDGAERRVLRVFASTFNVGSTSKGVAALGPVEAWIPEGFDLYVIVSRYSEPGGISSMLATPDPHTTY